MSGMIFSLFDPSLRMASIEVLDYRKDGEVEARRVTLVNITQRWPIYPMGTNQVRSPSCRLRPKATGVSRFSTAGPSGSAVSSTYFSQTAASELAAAQIAAHSPTENSAIAVIDAILLSRTAACRSARARDDSRSPSPRLMKE
jgi:hypothetical protein